MSRRLAMRAAALAFLAALAGCSGGRIDPASLAGAEQKADAALQSADPVVDAACRTVTGLDAGFQQLAAAGKIDAAGIAYERQVMAIHDALCAGGPPGDVADTLARLWYAASAITGVTPAKAAAS